MPIRRGTPPRWRSGARTSLRSCAIRSCRIPTTSSSGRSRAITSISTRRASRPCWCGRGASRSRELFYTAPPAAQPHGQRAVPRERPGHPARGRSQRHVLLDRKPFALPRPRSVRLEPADPDPPSRAQRPRQGRAARCRARSRARRGDRQSAQGRLQRARCSTTSTRARTPCAQELLSDSPIFDIVRRDAIEPLLERTELPNSQSKFLFNFVNARIFLEEFAS